MLKKYKEFFFIAAMGMTIVATMIYFKVSNDFGAHRTILEKSLNAGSFPVPPIYYGLLYLISFGLASGKIIFVTISLLAGFFIGLKYLVTRHIVSQIALKDTYQYGSKLFKKISLDNLIKILSFSMIILTPLSFGRSLYLGKIGINIWHNSTIIAEFPFALMLFYFSEKYLIKKEAVKYYNLLFLVCLVILIKPSYFLAFSVAFPVMNLIINYSITKRIKIDWQVILVVLTGLLLLFLQYIRIYGMNIVDSAAVTPRETKLMIDPFRVWSIHSKNILFDLLMSILYPLAFLIVYWKEIKQYKGYLYSILTFAVALLIAILFIESGPRDFHANYFWTSYIANYILFLYSAALNLRLILMRTHFLVKDYVLASIFGAHFLSGIYYIINLYVLKSF